MPQRPLNRLGFQEPKSNKLTNFHLPESLRRTQIDAPNAMVRAHKVLKSSLPNPTKATNTMEKYERKNKEEIHKELQDLDSIGSLT
jgi:hypothetical protein